MEIYDAGPQGEALPLQMGIGRGYPKSRLTPPIAQMGNDTPMATLPAALLVTLTLTIAAQE